VEKRQNLGPHALPGQEGRPRDVGRVAVGLEHTVRRGAARVHHPLRNAFVIEVRDLFAEVKVFQQGGPAVACLQGVVGVMRRPCAVVR
jgi:hypothetical protein